MFQSAPCPWPTCCPTSCQSTRPSVLPPSQSLPTEASRSSAQKVEKLSRMCQDPLRYSWTLAATSSEAARLRTMGRSLQSPINQPSPSTEDTPFPGVSEFWAPGSGKHESHLPVPSEPGIPKHLPGAEGASPGPAFAGAPDGRSGSLSRPPELSEVTLLRI